MNKRSWTQSILLTILVALGMALFIFLENTFPYTMLIVVVIGLFCFTAWLFRNTR